MSSQEVVVEGLAVEVAIDSLVVVEVVAAEGEVEAVEGFLVGEAVATGLTGEIRSVVA